MRGLGSRFLALALLWACLAIVQSQKPADYVMWRSFQQEMKTLEEAAHRVNDLLSRTQHQAARPKPADDAKAEATVLTEKREETTELATSESGLQLGITESSPDPHFGLGSLFNSFGLFGHLPQPWWKGKNVCVQKTENVDNKEDKIKDGDEDESVFFLGAGTFEHCKQTSGKYICTTVTSTRDSTKTVKEIYQCCEGYQRKASGCEPGDEAPAAPPTPTATPTPAPKNEGPYDVVDIGKSIEESFSSQSDEGNVVLKDPIEVLEELGSRDFASMIKSENVVQALADHNLTFFAPTDEAVRSHQVDFQESNQIRAKRVSPSEEERSRLQLPSSVAPPASSADILKAHIVPQLLDVDDFANEMVVKSLDESSLRVNIYPGREDAVVTVNCARVMSRGNLAKGARVHTVDRVLEPVTRSVLDVIRARPDLSLFRQHLEQQEDLMEMLSNVSSGVTVFAPNNEAWEKLGAGLREKYSRGEACIDKVIRHHVLPLTLCSAPADVADARLTVADVDGETVAVGRDPDGQLAVDARGRIAARDLVATDGVVHVVDKILTPKSAKPLSELLSSSNHTTWLSLLNRAGLAEELDRAENVTLLVPTERALSEAQEKLQALDDSALRALLLYHVTERVAACDMREGTEMRARSGHTLRVSAMRDPFGPFAAGPSGRAAVQCTPLARTDGRACHATAHEVTRLLSPPEHNVVDMIAADPKLAVLKQVLQETEIERELQSVNKSESELSEDGFTFLAPSDEAFTDMDDSVMTKLLSDKKYADEFLRAHIINEPVCCSSVAAVPWPFTQTVRTVDGGRLQVNRDHRDRVAFGAGSRADRCDLVATDGIVHVVDRVLRTENAKVKLGNVEFGSPDKKIMLFGI